MDPNIPGSVGGDQNRGPALLVVEGLSLGIAGAMVILRVYIRGRVKHILWSDDFCIVLALVWVLYYLQRVPAICKIASRCRTARPCRRCCASWVRQACILSTLGATD